MTVTRALWGIWLIALLAAIAGRLPLEWVLAPALGLVIYTIGIASFASLKRGADHIPDGEPEVVDHTEERTTYWCGGCGAELLLLVRGGATNPPRHCGEKMHERTEVARLN